MAKTTRRDFIQKSATVGAGIGLGGKVLGAPFSTGTVK